MYRLARATKDIEDEGEPNEANWGITFHFSLVAPTIAGVMNLVRISVSVSDFLFILVVGAEQCRARDTVARVQHNILEQSHS